MKRWFHFLYDYAWIQQSEPENVNTQLWNQEKELEK